MKINDTAKIRTCCLWTLGFWVGLLFLGLTPQLNAQTEGEAANVEAADFIDDEESETIPEHRYRLVEPFTADLLEYKEAKLGLINFDYGIDARMMLGTDFLADLIGAPNLKVKYYVGEWGANRFALGLRGAFLNRETILWGSVKKHFKKLEARIISPSVSWTNKMSSRLKLHTQWGMGLGKVKAELTESGKRKLWETKHPEGDYETKETDEEESGEEDSATNNQEKKSRDKPASFKQRTLMFSSVTGMLADIFQITGEYAREGGNKVLISSRIERTRIEDLKASSFRFTVAQQWIWENFQLRFGVGAMYLVITGTDLDGEEIDEAGVLPASDIDFYWRF